MVLSIVLLKHHDSLVVVNRGTAVKGKLIYNNANSIVQFDLTNWIWVEVKKSDDFSCLISSNMLDLDKSSGNFHALYDLIGLVVYYKKGEISYNNYICTDIDLPFDEHKLDKICQLKVE